MSTRSIVMPYAINGTDAQRARFLVRSPDPALQTKLTTDWTFDATTDAGFVDGVVPVPGGSVNSGLANVARDNPSAIPATLRGVVRATEPAVIYGLAQQGFRGLRFNDPYAPLIVEKVGVTINGIGHPPTEGFLDFLMVAWIRPDYLGYWSAFGFSNNELGSNAYRYWGLTCNGGGVVLESMSGRQIDGLAANTWTQVGLHYRFSGNSIYVRTFVDGAETNLDLAGTPVSRTITDIAAAPIGYTRMAIGSNLVDPCIQGLIARVDRKFTGLAGNTLDPARMVAADYLVNYPRIAASIPELIDLFGALSLRGDAVEGANAGTLVGVAAGSVLSLVSDAGGRVALSGATVIRGATGLDYATAQSHSFTVRETLAGSLNSPHDTVLTLAVTNPLDGAVLVDLGGSFSLPESAAAGDLAGSLTGMADGSVLTLSDDGGGAVALSGSDIVRGATALNYEDGAAISFTVAETLPNSPNSPRYTVFTLNVTNVNEQPALGELSGTFTLAEDVPIDTVAGTLTGMTAGSSLSLLNNADGRVKLVGDTIVRGAPGLDYEDPEGHEFLFTVRETLTDSPNSPSDTDFILYVTDVDDTGLLNDLSGSFSAYENVASGASMGMLSGVTSGSALSLSDDAGGRVALSGLNIIRGATALDYEFATSHSFTVVETLAGFTNSPKSTALTLYVQNVPEAGTLVALTGPFTLPEDAAAGAVAGSVNGKTTGSTLALGSDAGGRVALSGTNIVRGATALNYETAQSHSFTVTETLADSPNSPKTTTLTLGVTNVAEAGTLNDISLSAATFPTGAATGTIIGAILGATAGSSLVLSGTAGGKFAKSGSNLVVGTVTNTDGPWSIAFTETLADTTNSPHVTTLTVTSETEQTVSRYTISGDGSKAEGNSGAILFNYIVTRSGLTTGASSVDYMVAGQGANPADADDFTGGAFPAGTVSFAAGETSKSLAVSVAGDADLESNEGFSVTLSNPTSPAVITTASVTSTIVNDDVAASYALSDNFNRTAGALAGTSAQTGGVWSDAYGPTGYIAIDSSGRATVSGFGGGTSATCSNAATLPVDQSVEADFVFGTPGTITFGIAARSQSNGTKQYELVYSGSDNTWKLRRRTSAGTNPVIASLVETPASGTVRRVRLQVVGTGAAVAINVYFDGVLNSTLSYSDTNSVRITTGGVAALWAYRSTSSDTGVSIDNMTAGAST